jgi:plasmid stability protein
MPRRRMMAVLTIRNVPDEVRDRLRLRAARSGRSMEAEVRAILTEASLEDETRISSAALQAMVDDLYKGQKRKSKVDELIRERRKEALTE